MPASHAHDNLTRALVAERELRATRLRNRMLLRAANRELDTTSVVTTSAALAPLLRMASLIESSGRVPAVRFARDGEGYIVGVELVLVNDRESAPALPAFGEIAEMAVGGAE